MDMQEIEHARVGRELREHRIAVEPEHFRCPLFWPSGLAPEVGLDQVACYQLRFPRIAAGVTDDRGNGGS